MDVCDAPLPTMDSLGCLIPIPKKSSATSVDTMRPIYLLTTIYKLYAILAFQKVRDRVKEFVSWTQAGFIKVQSCSNNLWLISRVLERPIEFNIPIYCALVDYKSAFDALNRTTLGRVLVLFISPYKGIQLITHHLASLEYTDGQILFTLTAELPGDNC